MKTILIPTDFSETSEAAIDFGLQLADKHGYEVILHHSVDFMLTYESMNVEALNVRAFTPRIVEDCEERLDELLKKWDKGSVKVSKQLTIGSLIIDLKRVVKEKEVDLIIMGTHGASGWKELWVGSNTEKVVRLIDCPVISIPAKVRFEAIRKILVPVDLGEIRPGFLRHISEFQKLFSASVEFVWVKTPHALESTDLLTEQFNGILSKYEIASSSFTIIRDIFPDNGILKHAKDSDADMIAMATHARRGLAHLFTGSLTEDVMNHVNIPLWSFKLEEEEVTIDFDAKLAREN